MNHLGPESGDASGGGGNRRHGAITGGIGRHDVNGSGGNGVGTADSESAASGSGKEGTASLLAESSEKISAHRAGAWWGV